MEKIKNSFAAKTAAFLLILLCTAVVVMSAIVIVGNMESGWYSKNESAVEQDIYEETAYYINTQLTEKLYMYYVNAEPAELDGSEEGYIEIQKDIQLMEGENAASDFGYVLHAKNSDLRFSEGVNEENAEENMNEENADFATRVCNRALVEAGDGVYRKTFTHDSMDLEVYLGDIDEGSVPEDVYRVYRLHEGLYQYGKTAIVIGILGMICIICLFLFLMISVGKKEDSNGWLRKVPIELLLAVAVFLMVLLFTLSYNFIWEAVDLILALAMIVVAAVMGTAIVLGFLMILVIKGRQHTLWHGSICHFCYKICRSVLRWFGTRSLYLIQGLPLVWKSAALVFGGILINLFIVVLVIDSYAAGGAMLLWFVAAVITEGLAIYIALGMRKLREGAKRLAEGDLDYEIDKKGLFLDFAVHADDLNRIGEGMSKAVSERMKSERFKTELITNVSHDIKTPLTSIINYVDFLKKEEIENETAKEYIEVLDRQSQRLKKLTEDLLEASKAATGSVKLDIRPCQAGVLMVQVMGEYAERTKEEGLTLVSSIPDERIEIMADGRSMQRIFDNIFSNICKYSQSGTRVYQSLEKINDKAVITYKNTSRYELNITEEELMERFVRGDSSRHTEGSGLGLSIARNLAQLQGGSFRIHIDGDLFKVVMEFPLKQAG